MTTDLWFPGKAFGLGNILTKGCLIWWGMEMHCLGQWVGWAHEHRSRGLDSCWRCSAIGLTQRAWRRKWPLPSESEIQMQNLPHHLGLMLRATLRSQVSFLLSVAQPMLVSCDKFIVDPRSHGYCVRLAQENKYLGTDAMLLLFLEVLVPHHLMAAYKFEGSKYHQMQLPGGRTYRALMRWQ